MNGVNTVREQGHRIGFEIGCILKGQAYSDEMVVALAGWHYQWLKNLQGLVIRPLERFARADDPQSQFCDGFVDGFHSANTPWIGQGVAV